MVDSLPTHAGYYIDYENGTIPLGDLPIGTLVVDPTWKWEFRTGFDYTKKSGDLTKPVIWIMVAKNHYRGLGAHVTLLSEELIGIHEFHNDANQWRESNLRTWLNSQFYRAFSKNFKNAVLSTSVPNKEWAIVGNQQVGNSYTTDDNVFIPSETEIGGNEPSWDFPTGTTYSYFTSAPLKKRIVMINDNNYGYWTRTPHPMGKGKSFLVNVDSGGDFNQYLSFPGVRPVVNIKSDILVSEIKKYAH